MKQPKSIHDLLLKHTEKIRVIVLIFLLRFMYVDYAKSISYAQILFLFACYCKNQVSTWSIQTSIWVTIPNYLCKFKEIQMIPVYDNEL